MDKLILHTWDSVNVKSEMNKLLVSIHADNFLLQYLSCPPMNNFVELMLAFFPRAKCCPCFTVFSQAVFVPGKNL